MPSPQLPNYLRSHRKRLGLSQKEVAYLLGTDEAAKVCRYERFIRSPSLRTALAYEIIFQRSSCELFAGLFRSIQKEVAARAKILCAKTESGKQDQRSLRKRQMLLLISVAHLEKAAF